MAETRAILFDLDDTLYGYRAFVRSGFRALASRLAVERGLPARAVLRVLRQALVGGAHGRELQVLCDRFALPLSLVPSFTAIIREHAPALTLPHESRHVLQALAANWRVGIVTNGSAHIQRRKVAALGVERYVDTVVYATEHGDFTGKPSAAAFETALARLSVEPASAVFVGDDWQADMVGASAVGMHTIHLLGRRRAAACDSRVCGAHLHRLSQVPAVADRLIANGDEESCILRLRDAA